jgi:hypothetical protein
MYYKSKFIVNELPLSQQPGFLLLTRSQTVQEFMASLGLELRSPAAEH